MQDDYEQQTMEEARYWFSLNAVVDFMEIVGDDQVYEDLEKLYLQRSRVKANRVNKDIDFDDVPF